MVGRKIANVITSRQFALYKSSDFFSNCAYFSSSLAKIWMSFMPERCSDKNVFKSVMRFLVSSYAFLDIKRKKKVSTVTSGSSAKDTRAILTLMESMTTAYPIIFTMFLKSFTKMVEKSSLTASVSLETRVTSFPTGVLLKKFNDKL